jgi:hypothetical protein
VIIRVDGKRGGVGPRSVGDAPAVTPTPGEAKMQPETNPLVLLGQSETGSLIQITDHLPPAVQRHSGHKFRV